MPQTMATEIQKQCETIEECYEFTLSYAARGLASDEGSELREQLTRAVAAMRGLERSCAEAIREERLASAEKLEAFFAVVKRDAESALATMELVLAQPAIGSQLIDNLNASIHLRALLADLFLVTEILAAQQTRAKAAQA
jgi:ATPase subunit of ABC transporter with duplicated ATPase domains